ncbi:Uncharacterized protein APZ42_031861 [Daphnia magna]|uniref:Uncharacterized protein n=1 Tax=Daphnia magna TaxID=35525 RepID=A0A164MH28_9CRUS|nr:Uncharacterized protein APZ42_031861 [Daphnia magna]
MYNLRLRQGSMLNAMHNITYNMYCFLVFPELVSKATMVIKAGTPASSRSSSAPSTSSRHVAEQTNYSSAEESSDEEEEDEDKEEDEDGFHALKDAFPIKKENLEKMDTRNELKFVLNLIETLYSPLYLRLHKKSGTKATHGDDLKIPIPREQCHLLYAKGEIEEISLPPKLESAISQKFNQVRPTAADKQKLRQYWKMQNTQNP